MVVQIATLTTLQSSQEKVGHLFCPTTFQNGATGATFGTSGEHLGAPGGPHGSPNENFCSQNGDFGGDVNKKFALNGFAGRSGSSQQNVSKQKHQHVTKIHQRLIQNGTNSASVAEDKSEPGGPPLGKLESDSELADTDSLQHKHHTKLNNKTKNKKPRSRGGRRARVYTSMHK